MTPAPAWRRRPDCGRITSQIYVNACETMKPMTPARSILRAFAAFMFVAALAACAAAPHKPLMSPLDDGGEFGYSATVADR